MNKQFCAMEFRRFGLGAQRMKNIKKIMNSPHDLALPKHLVGFFFWFLAGFPVCGCLAFFHRLINIVNST